MTITYLIRVKGSRQETWMLDGLAGQFRWEIYCSGLTGGASTQAERAGQYGLRNQLPNFMGVTDCGLKWVTSTSGMSADSFYRMVSEDSIDIFDAIPTPIIQKIINYLSTGVTSSSCTMHHMNTPNSTTCHCWWTLTVNP